MSKINIENMTVGEFCAIQGGIDDASKSVMERLHKGTDSYEGWYEKLKNDFKLQPIKGELLMDKNA